MYCVVSFVDNLDVKALPIKFVKNFDPIAIGNYALDQSEIYTVFYSKNISECPNFSLDLHTKFKEMTPGCYQARILNFFGTSHFSFALFVCVLICISYLSR